MSALALVAFGRALQQLWSDTTPSMRETSTEGPFPATLAVNGRIVFGPAIQALHRGEAFGWASTFCATPHTRLLLQSRLVNQATGAIALTREDLLEPNPPVCGSARLDIVPPPEIPPGRYQLQRLLLLTPSSGTPRLQTLPSLTVEILP